MTTLTTWAADEPGTALATTDTADTIAATLSEVGVRFERWPVRALAPGAGPDEVLAAYRDLVDEVVATEGFKLVDVVALRPDGSPGFPAAAAARSKFLAEHTHDDDEVRFFAAGAGLFCLHIGARVYGLLCAAGDLLSVPRGTTHWFDMGTTPDFTAIRFFHDPDGWVGDFTGSDIAAAFPDFDALAVVAAT